MTLTELNTILKSVTGFSNKVAYRQFPKGKAPKLPFICYLVTNSDNFYADNRVYMPRTNVDIELYSQLKDLSSEQAIETVLGNHNITWEKTEDYIESESCYMITYNIQI